MRDVSKSFVSSVSVTLFTSLGKPIDNTIVEPIRDFASALEIGFTDDWMNFRIRRRNEMTSWLSEHASKQVFDQWNTKAQEIRTALTSASISARLEDFAQSRGLVKRFAGEVTWDLVNACMEWEYESHWSGTFYRALAEWYQCGHWPCGWAGEYPDGKLIVH